MSHGADINQADEAHRTPLWHAKYMAKWDFHYASDDMVVFLESKGASLTPTDGRFLSVPMIVRWDHDVDVDVADIDP